MFNKIFCKKIRSLIYFLLLPFYFLLISGCGGGVEVEVVSPRTGEIYESFTEPAKTRLENTYLIAMPVDGRIGRINFEPGDKVEAGQKLLEYDLVPFLEEVEEAKAALAEIESEINVKEDNRLENTAMIEMKTTVDAAAEAVKAADAQVESEKARSDRASKELERKEKLFKQNAISETIYDDAKLDAETTLIELRKQEFYKAAMNAIFVAVKLGPRYVDEYLGKKDLQKEVLKHKLAQAKARLARAEHTLKLTDVISPINGIVLERYERGDKTLAAGHDLLLIGNLDELEVISDVLTGDALKLSAGTKVMLQPSSRFEPIEGKVKRIEPSGFTKLSSLGVEQQRVNVIVSFVGGHNGLGVGYRLLSTFYTGYKNDALIVPRYSVLQGEDQSYYVLKAAGGKIKVQPVKLGLKSDLEIEIVEGLSGDDKIIAKPDTNMKEGMSVKVKS